MPEIVAEPAFTCYSKPQTRDFNNLGLISPALARVREAQPLAAGAAGPLLAPALARVREAQSGKLRRLACPISR